MRVIVIVFDIEPRLRVSSRHERDHGNLDQVALLVVRAAGRFEVARRDSWHFTMKGFAHKAAFFDGSCVGANKVQTRDVRQQR